MVLVLSAASSSCWFRKAPPVFTPPPPQVVTNPAPVETQPLPAPPTIEGDPSATLPPVPATIPTEAPEPSKPKPPARRPTTPTKTVPAPTQAPEQPPPPRLGQIFTPDQLRALNHTLDESLDRVKRALTVLAAKPLNPEQVEIINKIRTFEKQAEQTRQQDLFTAVSLARRADLLAQDLMERFP